MPHTSPNRSGQIDKAPAATNQKIQWKWNRRQNSMCDFWRLFLLYPYVYTFAGTHALKMAFAGVNYWTDRRTTFLSFVRMKYGNRSFCGANIQNDIVSVRLYLQQCGRLEWRYNKIDKQINAFAIRKRERTHAQAHSTQDTAKADE